MFQQRFSTAPNLQSKLSKRVLQSKTSTPPPPERAQQARLPRVLRQQNEFLSRRVLRQQNKPVTQSKFCISKTSQLPKASFASAKRANHQPASFASAKRANHQPASFASAKRAASSFPDKKNKPIKHCAENQNHLLYSEQSSLYGASSSSTGSYLRASFSRTKQLSVESSLTIDTSPARTVPEPFSAQKL